MNSVIPKTPKIGLALGAGAARGWAHVGVLKALEESSIPVDMISGTSMGALVGALYARGKKAATLEELALGVDWKQLVHLADLNLLFGKGFIRGRKLKEVLRSLIGDVRFEDLKIPLAIVAADAQTSEEIIFTKGSVIEAVRASISLPVIFTPVKWKDRFLVDGGVVDPVPVDIVRDMGADVVIAVNVIPEPQRGKYSESEGEEIPDAILNLHSGDTHLVAIKKRIDSLLQEDEGKIKIFEKPYNVVKNEVYRGKEKIEARYHEDRRLEAAKKRIDSLLEESKDKIKVFEKPRDVIKSKIYRGKEKIEARYHEDRRLEAARKRIDSLLEESKDKFKGLEELCSIAKTKFNEAKGELDPQTPHIFDTLMQAIEAMEYERVRLRIKSADIVISPDVSYIKSFEFYKGEEAIAQGYKATKDILPKLEEIVRSTSCLP